MSNYFSYVETYMQKRLLNNLISLTKPVFFQVLIAWHLFTTTSKTKQTTQPKLEFKYKKVGQIYKIYKFSRTKTSFTKLL